MKFMIRFGKKAHLQEIIDGKIRFSPVQSFIDLESAQEEKGRGDYKEGKTELKSGHCELTDLSNGEKFPINEGTNILYSFENLVKTPVFCLSYYDGNSIIDYISTENYTIKLPTNNYECIRKDFKDADYGLIILEPEKFINNINNIKNHKFSSDKIQYIEDDSLKKHLYVAGLTKSDLDAANGSLEFHIYKSNLYRYLFCKDPYFKNQNEYRFLNMDSFIEESVFYDFNFTSQYMLVPIEKLERTLNIVY